MVEAMFPSSSFFSWRVSSTWLVALRICTQANVHFDLSAKGWFQMSGNQEFSQDGDALNVSQRNSASRGGPIIHCYENPISAFPFWDLRCLSPNFHIHSCVSERFVYSQDRFTYLAAASKVDRPTLKKIYKSLTDTRV
jgi:hypothetical protein